MKNKILFVLCLLNGLMFINSGLNKLFHYIPVPADMPEKMKAVGAAFMEIGWLMPLVAVVEIIGGILYIIPKYRALGAIMLFPVVIGILLTHLTAAPEGTPIAVVFLAINLWVIFENRAKYMPMVK